MTPPQPPPTPYHEGCADEIEDDVRAVCDGIFGPGGSGFITHLRARNQGRKMSVDFWLAVDTDRPAGDTLARVEQLRSSVLARCTGVGEVVVQLHPKVPPIGAMDAPQAGGSWWGGGDPGGSMR